MLCAVRVSAQGRQLVSTALLSLFTGRVWEFSTSEAILAWFFFYAGGLSQILHLLTFIIIFVFLYKFVWSGEQSGVILAVTFNQLVWRSFVNHLQFHTGVDHRIDYGRNCRSRKRLKRLNTVFGRYNYDQYVYYLFYCMFKHSNLFYFFCLGCLKSVLVAYFFQIKCTDTV